MKIATVLLKNFNTNEDRGNAYSDEELRRHNHNVIVLRTTSMNLLSILASHYSSDISECVVNIDVRLFHKQQ